MRFRIRKTVSWHEAMAVEQPWYWGLAYQNSASAHIVLYIIPLNWIVWAWRELIWKLRLTPKGTADKIYQKGWNDAMINALEYKKYVQESKDVFTFAGIRFKLTPEEKERIK